MPHLADLATEGRIHRHAPDRAVRLAQVQAAVRADPQPPIGFRQQRAGGAERAGVAAVDIQRDVVETAAVRPQAVQPVLRGDPQLTIGRLRDAPDFVVGEAVRLVVVMRPVPEAAAPLVVDGEPGRDATGPDPVVAIDEQRIGLVRRQRQRIAHDMPEYREVDPVETHQAAGRTEPHQAVAILCRGIDRPAGQAIRRLVAAELRRRQRTCCLCAGRSQGNRHRHERAQHHAQQPSGQP